MTSVLNPNQPAMDTKSLLVIFSISYYVHMPRAQ